MVASEEAIKRGLLDLIIDRPVTLNAPRIPNIAG